MRLFASSLFFFVMLLGPAQSQTQNPKSLAIAMSKGLMDIIDKDFQAKRTPALVAVSERLLLCAILYGLQSKNPHTTKPQEFKAFEEAYVDLQRMQACSKDHVDDLVARGDLEKIFAVMLSVAT